MSHAPFSFRFASIFLPSLFLLFLVANFTVQAQELTTAESMTVSPTVELTPSPTETQQYVDQATGQIWEKDDLETQIKDVKAQYQSQLETYLYKDKQYRVAYDQNKELQTLASIEDLLQKSKDLGLSRDEVLISYLTLLKLTLISTEGIELSIKTNYLQQTEDRLSYLQQHQSHLQGLTDRAQVEAALADFTTRQKDLPDFCKSILALLSVGKLQIVYDKAFALKKDINTFLVNNQRDQDAVILRASQETDQSLSAANLKLNDFWTKTLSEYQNSRYLVSLYDDLPSEMNPIYVNLSQSLSYLGELLKL